ncbi:DCC1-like thiol-disulfide oxidoreductase family protein [Rummeliibacillus suwonensis]|uniref:DCC1-like thiol-disulfide oxidoreductase family protein n=1 Tax=Rummeliibacillus suwonensis TaxID=1306154 RepID=UPI0028A1DECE|nr:DCC1-like thiol-disulfide oxidoreductase family protein [Rummeliibacillus suwonensis]
MYIKKTLRKKFELTVFYDSWCPKCTAIKNKVETLDWLKLITMKSFREESNIKNLKIDHFLLEKEMYAQVAYNNSLVSGIEAFASMSIRIPLLMVLWIPLKVGSLIKIGQYLYNYFAQRRKIIPVGQCESNICVIQNNKK